MKKVIFLIASLFVLLPARSYSSDLRVSGIYSSLDYHDESGDLVGEEFFIIPKKDGYMALVQLAEGGFPYTAFIPIKVTDNKIEFSLPSDGPYSGGEFKGVIKKDSIEGKYSGSMHGENIKLKKGKSYWQ